ncbi:MAG TPA: metalloregulator ArsR/SmtB family transcription factor [Longimicrobiales bacterium]|nr:metalloregulator ArsR/SmtB family transcription factor [Longimicrobiales bacterium]
MDPQAGTAPAHDTVRVLAALSDVNRYRIVELLALDAPELTCGAICSALGLSPSLVSHHLSVLEGAGVIDRRKNGLWTLNRLRRDELARRLAGLQRIIYTNGNSHDGTPAISAVNGTS